MSADWIDVLLTVSAAMSFFIVVLPALFVRFGAVHRGPRAPVVALTIDDGPDPTSTPALLTALADNDVKATFFCVAAKLEAYPALGQAIVSAGHELANHSYAHSHVLAFWPLARAERELRRAQEVLLRFGSASTYFRAVAGVLSPPLYWAAKRVGLTPIHWTASARDGGPLPVADARALKRLRPGLVPGGILVIHDRPPAARWIRALKQATPLAFVTLSDMMRIRAHTLQPTPIE